MSPKPKFDYKTDPYGSLSYAIGSADDFHCFDYCISKDKKWVHLHATLNSETGSFIMDTFDEIVPIEEAITMAMGIHDDAMMWLVDNDVEHDEEGWDQKPEYFLESVIKDVESVLKPVGA